MLESLSSRRAWIEIIEYEKDNSTGTVALLTESVDRNCFKQDVANKLILSLSSRRAWIEIYAAGWIVVILAGRSPHGERG